MKLNKLIALLLSLVLIVSMMAGCGNQQAAEPPAEETPDAPVSKPVETPAADEEEKELVNIKIYTRVAEQEDMATVMEALNAYTAEKIGVTAEWVFLGGTFAEKIQVIATSGEEYDAAYTSTWMNPYAQGATKGAFVDLTDLLPEYAPELYEQLPDYMWDATRIGGQIYAIPNQQIVARQYSAWVPTEIAEAAEAAGVEVPETISALTDLYDLAVFAKENYGTKLASIKTNDIAAHTSYEWINDYLSCGVVKMGAETPTVVNIYETQEWLDLLHMLYDLNEEGLLDGQIAYDTEYYNSQKLGMKLTADWSVIHKPGVDAEMSAALGYPATIITGAKPAYISTGSVIATMYAISSTSKHPIETLQYFNLLNTDPVALNMLCYGIEGTHYEVVSDTQVRLIEGSGYAPAANWAFGDTFNAYVLEGQPADANAKTAEINNSAMASTILGFVFDTEPVKSEIASVSKVVQEYEGLLGGELPVEETNAEFVEKLKIAGIDTVIAEMQRQVDAFMASK